jgi:hypothetical protein
MSIVYIISAPSGSGKSIPVSRLLRRDSKLLFSISYTTRASRRRAEGENYHHISGKNSNAGSPLTNFRMGSGIWQLLWNSHRVLGPGSGVRLRPAIGHRCARCATIKR